MSRRGPDLRFAASRPAQQSDEEALVAGVRAGDAAAFEVLFRRYYDGLYRFVYSYVGRRDRAEELVQEVFTRIWQHRSEWTVAGTVKSYLFCVARNGAISLARHERVVRAHEEEVLAVHAVEPQGAEAADVALERAELGAAVALAVARLPERTRQVLALRRQHEMTYAEIAAVMQISVKGVEYHLGVAAKALREDLADFEP